MTQPPPQPTGQTPNKQINRQAWALLRGRWILAIGFWAVVWSVNLAFGTVMHQLLVLGGIDSPSSSLFTDFKSVSYWAAYIMGMVLVAPVGAPLLLSSAFFFLALVRRQEANIGIMFAGFNNFGKAMGALLLTNLLIHLGLLLLIVPGIIAALSCAQTFYVLADDPTVGTLAAMRKSREMMRGHRYKLFCLWAGYFGWALLFVVVWVFGIGRVQALVPSAKAWWWLWLVTWCIGFACLFPYFITGTARFYEDLRGARVMPLPAVPPVVEGTMT
jgi:uncharacterized membrane protein